MIRYNLILILVVFFLTSCSTLPVPPTPIGLTTDLQYTTTPAVTLIPKSTPSTTLGSSFTQECLQVPDQEMALEEVIAGTILLRVPADNRLILKDILTGVEYKLPALSKVSSWDWYPQIPAHISPDGKMLAHMEEVNNTEYILSVFDTQANALASISVKQVGLDLGSVHWLDKEHLIIGIEQYGTVLVVNPFTGEQQVISKELPNLFTHFNPWPMWRVVYSPDLEMVIYYEGQQHPEGPVVYDVVKNQIIWQVKGEQRGHPVWSPSGEEVAVVGGVGDTQIYLVNRLGHATALLSETQEHDSFAPFWSPDGQYLVFWDNGTLMAYDKHSNLVTDFCIPWVRETLNSATLHWSMDSQQFIVTNTGLTTFIPGSVLVDLEKNVAYKLKDTPNTFIVGWMDSLP